MISMESHFWIQVNFNNCVRWAQKDSIVLQYESLIATMIMKLKEKQIKTYCGETKSQAKSQKDQCICGLTYIWCKPTSIGEQKIKRFY